MKGRRGVAALAVALGAFALYHATLLPGLDLGDTASFQTMAGSAFITPRDGYPLYFAIGQAVLWTSHADPARALNLASALQAALASGLTVLLAAELSGSLPAGVAVAVLFAGSYTFWSQSIIAEVYALHAVFVSLTLLLLLRWERRQTLARLAGFFAAYGLAFGNHLSMILLLPANVIFLLAASSARPDDPEPSVGWRALFRWRVVLVATVCAVVGALPYAWNMSTMWLLPQPPAHLGEALQRFWFDVTKSDWRETMILRVPEAVLRDRAAAYWFDLTQQFGAIVPPLAGLGLGVLAFRNWRRALLIGLAYVSNVAFAYTYNVGDTHVFYLPSHLMIAVLCAPAIAWLGGLRPPMGSGVNRTIRPRVPEVAVVVMVYAAFRIFADYPALDRSGDRRPTEVIATLTSGLDDEHAILLTDLNWQVENALSYRGRVPPPLPHARMAGVLLYAPTLIDDNLQVGRGVVLTSHARDELLAAYGPLFSSTVDPIAAVPTLEETARRVPEGTRFVLSLLKPTRDYTVDREDVRRALIALTHDPAIRLPDEDYVAVTGVAGKPAPIVLAGRSPFRRELRVDDVGVQIRFDSWLAFDTIRRMGFGHVIVNRRHTLIVERGVSFVAFEATGEPRLMAYAGTIFAPEPRYVISGP